MIPFGTESMAVVLKTPLRYHKYVFNMIKPYLGKRVAEIGCGYGIYTQMLARRGTVLANDVGTKHMLLALDLPNVTTLAGDITKRETQQAVERFKPDTILMLQVLEHICSDSELLWKLANASPMDTRLILFVPAFPALYGPMDRQVGHYGRYTKKSLDTCLWLTGWTVDECYYCNPIGGIGWWLNNRVLSRWARLNASHITSQVLFFDRFLLPLSKFMERFTRRFFGQGLMLIATKR